MLTQQPIEFTFALELFLLATLGLNNADNYCFLHLTLLAAGLANLLDVGYTFSNVKYLLQC